MKKADREIVVSDSTLHGVSNHEAERIKGKLPPVSRWHLVSKPVVTTGIAVALGITVFALSYFVRVTGAHPTKPLESPAQLGSPPFANPSEVRYRTGEKRLRAVMELDSGNYTIPNVG